MVTENDIPDIVNRFTNLAGEDSRSRKDQSFLVPVEEIRENGYILSVNKYKEIDREKVSYEPSEIIFGRIIKTEDDIAAALMEFKEKYLK